MPIYEYRCVTCGKAYEELLSRADSPTPACPSCGADNAERLMSVVGGVHVGSPKASCSSGPGCQTASECGCRSCPMSNN